MTKQNGFALIDLIVVIFIIGLLGIISVTVYKNHVKRTNLQKQTSKNAQQNMLLQNKNQRIIFPMNIFLKD
jgi:Tfp pilus assembly protein PilE